MPFSLILTLFNCGYIYLTHKPMGFRKNSTKREVYSNKFLPQEARKALNRQSNSISKAA